MVKIESLLTHQDENNRLFAKGYSKVKDLYLKELSFKEYPNENLNCGSLIFEKCNFYTLPKNLKVKKLLHFKKCSKIKYLTNLSFPTATLEIFNCNNITEIKNLKVRNLTIGSCNNLQILENIEAENVDIFQNKQLKTIKNFTSISFSLTNPSTLFLENLQIAENLILDDINELATFNNVTFNYLDLLEKVSAQYLEKLLKGNNYAN